MDWINKIRCILGIHDYVSVPPNDAAFNSYYKFVSCGCSEIFRNMEHLNKHFKYVAPICMHNRVCMTCHKIDLRLQKAVDIIILEQHRKEFAKQLLEKGTTNEIEKRNIIK